MSFTLLNLATRKARKTHRCIWCGESINACENYQEERSVYDGVIQFYRWHPECRMACCEEMTGNFDDTFLPHENERPNDKV
jgi:hypothetical protein